MSAFTPTIGSPEAALNPAAIAAEHGIPASYFNVLDVGREPFVATQAFLSAVAAGKPARHPITDEWVRPAGDHPVSPAPVAIAGTVEDDPIVGDVRTEATETEPADPWGAGIETFEVDTDTDTEGDTTETVEADKPKRRKGRPYDAQFVGLPRDIVVKFRECHGYVPAAKGAAKDDAEAQAIRATNRAGKGRPANRMQIRDLYLAATLYRAAPIPTEDTDPNEPVLVIIEPSALAAGSDWVVGSLRDAFNSDTPPLPAYVRKVEGNHYNDEGRVTWHFELLPVDAFLKVPAWWFWKEPTPGSKGKARWVKSCEWTRGSPALLVALAYLHISDWDTNTSSAYGKGGLATVCGVSPQTIKKGRREARAFGFLYSPDCAGGKAKAKVTVCLRSDDAEKAAAEDAAKAAAEQAGQAAA